MRGEKGRKGGKELIAKYFRCLEAEKRIPPNSGTQDYRLSDSGSELAREGGKGRKGKRVRIGRFST